MVAGKTLLNRSYCETNLRQEEECVWWYVLKLWFPFYSTWSKKKGPVAISIVKLHCYVKYD